MEKQTPEQKKCRGLRSSDHEQISFFSAKKNESFPRVPVCQKKKRCQICGILKIVETPALPIIAAKYRFDSEFIYLVLEIILSAMYWLWLPLSFTILIWLYIDHQSTKSFSDFLFSSWYVFFFFLGTVFSYFVSFGYIRMNSIKVGPDQFPEIWKIVQDRSENLGLKTVPSVFILNGMGVMNAFAAKLVFRRVVILYSDLINVLVEKNDYQLLDSVICHELGHHALSHTSVLNWFLFPADLIPFLGVALSRSREYSADRIMKVAMHNDSACEKALVYLAAGRGLGSFVNVDLFYNQRHEEGGFYAWLAEKLADHPHLPNRLAAIRDYKLPEAS